MKRVTVIGGGTGTFVVLSGLRDLPLALSVVVSTADSGGSTGRLRDQYGVLPPGDVRQCLVALSQAPEVWRKLFLYRFEHGDFKGHNFGNIFLTALEQITSNYQDVIDLASYILQAKGHVIPVTYEKVHLCAEYEDGDVLETEDLIDTAFHKESRIKRAYLKPKITAQPDALYAIELADYIILGPGDIYTSIVPNFLAKGMHQKLASSRSKVIYISNLMTKKGQTNGYSVMDHVHDLEKYMGRKINGILINNAKVDSSIGRYYHKHGESFVRDDVKGSLYTVIRDDFIEGERISQLPSDLVLRSIVRHDPMKVAQGLRAIMDIV